MNNYPDERVAWVEEFETFGLYSLTDKVSEYMLSCRSKIGSSPSYLNALEFARRSANPDLLAYYLGRISPRLLTAFILGKATSWSHTDHTLESLLQEHSLTQAPMVYINVVCRRKYSPGSADRLPDRYAGHSVSVKELEKVLAMMKEYIKTEVPATVLAHDIDCAVQKDFTIDASKSDKYQAGRKFLPSTGSIDRVRRWVYQVEKKVIGPAQKENQDTPDNLEEPMEWCFQEVGFSRSGQQRASHHTIQEGTNHLLGLFYATLQYCFKDMFEMRQYRWSYVAEPEHANFLEIVGSMVNGTYGLSIGGTSLGIGLNPALAGGMPMSGPHALTDPKLRPSFKFAQQELAKSGAWQEHLDHIKSSAEFMSEGLDKKQKLVEVERETEQTQNKKQKLSLRAHEEVKGDLLSAVASLRRGSKFVPRGQVSTVDGVIVKQEPDEHQDDDLESI